MKILLLVTVLSVIVSFCFDYRRTLKALKIAGKKMKKILPSFALMLMFVSVVLYILPEKVILATLDNESRGLSLLLASSIGSVSVLPGFIAFPLCRLLLQKGVTYMVLSAFSTTLMMVGLVSIPIEIKYFGVKISILRNLVSLLIALIIALVTGLIFGEL